jgi:hypothetical protein
MTAQTRPRNLLETTMLEASVRRAVEKIAQEQRAVVEAVLPKALKQIDTKDQSGRTITTFEGDPSVWLNDFAMVPKKVISINTR